MQLLPRGAEQLAGEKIRPLKRVEYDKLVAEGCFADERLELLFGVVVEMSPPDHCNGGGSAQYALMFSVCTS